MQKSNIKILFEDETLLVVDKPAGMGTMGMPDGQETIQTWAKTYLTKGDGQPEPFVGISGRLDVPVAGLVVIAKIPQAAACLTDQHKQGTMTKLYHALVSGKLNPPQGTLTHWLKKAGIHAKVRIVAPDHPQAQEARLQYQVLSEYTNATLVRIQLDTGRKHQIRTQLSHIGHPIWGDYKYGSRMVWEQGIALVAKRIGFCHPLTNQPISFETDYPDYWSEDIDAMSKQDKTWLGRD